MSKRGILNRSGFVAWAFLGSVLWSAGGAAAPPAANWTAGSGNWNVPSYWSTNPNYPNNGTPAGTEYAAAIVPFAFDPGQRGTKGSLIEHGGWQVPSACCS